MHGIDWIELLIAMILSTVGGVVRKFSELEQNPKLRISLRQYIISSVISCFVGIIMYAILKNYEWSMLLIMAVVSIAGFIGSPIMTTLSSVLMKRLNKEIDGEGGIGNDKN